MFALIHRELVEQRTGLLTKTVSGFLGLRGNVAHSGPASSPAVSIVWAHAIEASVDFGPDAGTKFGVYFLSTQHSPGISVKQSYCLRPGIDPVSCVPDGAGATSFRGQKTWRLVIDATGEPPIEVGISLAEERN